MPSKLDFYQQKATNQAAQLRETLNFLEANSFVLNRDDKQAILNYLKQMDVAYKQLTSLNKETGPDLTAELLRFTTLKEQLQKKASTMLKILGGATALRTIRPKTAFSAQQPWWFIDQTVAQQQKKLLVKLTKIGGVLVLLLLIFVILFNTVFKPDPLVILKNQYEAKALNLATIEQNYQDALFEVEEALIQVPNDVDLLVLKSVLLTQLNRTKQAEPLLEQANNLTQQPEYVLFIKGQYLLSMKQLTATLETAQQSININPEYAEAWLLAGQTHAELEQIEQAREAFTIAADLAFEQGKDSIYTYAKVNLAYLMPAYQPQQNTEPEVIETAE